MERVFNFLAILRTRLWIVPAIMSTGGLALAYALLGPLRPWATFGNSQLWWLFSGDAGSARNLLGALLSGTMTMTSLVVSLTFVTLTLAANQLGPRLIVSFVADRQIQAVLGFFLATILYLIVVLRTVGDELGPETVPHFAITTASLLTICCMFALLFYVHKISRAIVADNVIDRVFGELRSAIDSGFPDCETAPAASHVGTAMPPVRCSVSLEHAGYIQTIDYNELVALAEGRDVVLDVRVKAGDFVLRGGPHVDVRAMQEIPSDAVQDLRDAIVIGSERSPAQDIEYSIRQLVELALRALSPGINDPFTAIAAIDRLGAAMELVLARPPIPTQFFDSEERLRVIVVRSTAASLADSCFDQIRRASTGNSAVLIHLTNTLGKLASSCRGEAASGILIKHLYKIEELSAATGPTNSDRAILIERLEVARQDVRGAAVLPRP